MARTQATGSEILDGSINGADVDESTLLDSLIPFVEPEFIAANIHDAIIESRNKSVIPWKVLVNDEMIIPPNTQLLNYNGMEVRGQLTIRGTLGLI